MASKRPKFPVYKAIRRHIRENQVVVFMEGTPEMPHDEFQCEIVKILTAAGVKFKAVNVCEENDIWDSIRLFSNYPCLPQLFINDDFATGLSDLRDIYEAGIIKRYFEEDNIVPIQ